MALNHAGIRINREQRIEPGHVRRGLEHPAFAAKTVLVVLQELLVRFVHWPHVHAV